MKKLKLGDLEDWHVSYTKRLIGRFQKLGACV